MIECYKCLKPLTSSNESDEHIIPNSCGGRLKSKKLLCVDCNSTFGKANEDELARQTNLLMNQLLIKRHRGTPPPIKGNTVSNPTEIIIQYGERPKLKHPTVSKNDTPNATEISIQARDMEEMESIVNNLKRKHPNVDIEDMIKKAEVKYMNEPIRFQTDIGGDLVFKAIAKSAINYYIYQGGERHCIEHLLPVIEDNNDCDFVWFHYPTKPIYQPIQGEVSHIIRIIGDTRKQILYAYLELFNVYNYIIILNNNYNAPEYDETYIYNVLNMKKISKNISLRYTREKLHDIFYRKEKPYWAVQNRFKRVLKIAQKRQSNHSTKQLTAKSVADTLGKQPDDVTITQEMIDKLVADIRNNISDYLM